MRPFHRTFIGVLVPKFLMITIVAGVMASAVAVQAQKLSEYDRGLGRTMAKMVKEDLRKNYYDPNFHGMDLDVRFDLIEKDIQAAATMADVFGAIAEAVAELNDSHTTFYPPDQTVSADYGWEMLMIGDRCFVVAVKPGSGAEAQGLKRGDEILQVDQFVLSRQNLWRFYYLYKVLTARNGVRVAVRKPDGQRAVLNIPAKVKERKVVTNISRRSPDYYEMIRESQNAAKLYENRYYESINDVFVWQMPTFLMAPEQLDDIMGKAHQRKALVLDLRGNGGGYVTTLQRLLGYIFDHEVKIGDLHQRKETKALTAKIRSADRVFPGKLVVLVDSASGSAAELFARVIQLEKRGIVIGDRSSGSVMQSQYYDHRIGLDIAIFYGTTVTNADIIMTDGKSLEHVGVVPDKVILPTAADLAATRDPALAYAASLAGAELSSEKAGTLFPWQWVK